jgi:hypothetical protein
MAAAGVNLDALIPREDLATLSGPPKGTPTSNIGIGLLCEEFFVSGLRKPDFQRETADWTPQKITELVAAFLDGDLIPAIILWRSGQYTFVIDGAHRLSAILAWIYDDYGDKSRSLNFFGGQIPEEQIRLAEQTRSSVNSSVGSYSDLKDKSRVRNVVSGKLGERLGGLATNSFVVQWVPAVDAEGAERSFFKINQAPTPVDPVEKRILRGRAAGNAIAARAINRGGGGHKYWGHFDREDQEEIEKLGRQIYEILYLPPLGEGETIKTSDVPVGGRGYSSLPFIYELVNLVNGLGKGDSANKDIDGSQTISYLRTVKKRLEQITSNHPGSVGLHPLVYFYTRGGAFQPSAFLAALDMVNKLFATGKVDEFCRVREKYESFLLQHKEAFSLIVTSLGSGGRSRPAMENFFEWSLQGVWAGKPEGEIAAEMSRDARFRFLTAPAPVRGQGGAKKGFGASVKSAAFISALQREGVRCGICGGLVHRNSITTDHKTRKADGGGNHYQNAQPSHPYCNSGYKEKQSNRNLGDQRADPESM